MITSAVLVILLVNLTVTEAQGWGQPRESFINDALIAKLFSISHRIRTGRENVRYLRQVIKIRLKYLGSYKYSCSYFEGPAINKFV